jgi:hypothetical protein
MNYDDIEQKEIKDLDLKTRTFVLGKALQVEKEVGDLLSYYLKVTKEKQKALSNKSGSFSFKNKIDLLIDIDVLSTEEHQKLLLLMEYRNQFMHNWKCNTFGDAFTFLENEKKNKLIKFLVVPENFLEEKDYCNAFDSLSIECVSIIYSKAYKLRELEIENREMILSLFSGLEKMMTRYTELGDSIMNYVEKFENNNSSDLIDLPSQVVKILLKHIDEGHPIAELISLKQKEKEILRRLSQAR